MVGADKTMELWRPPLAEEYVTISATDVFTYLVSSNLVIFVARVVKNQFIYLRIKARAITVGIGYVGLVTNTSFLSF